MSAEYDAIYAAVSDNFFTVRQHLEILQEYHVRPSVLYRPRLLRDGNQFCALYGDDLQSGVAGFGDSPEKAMLNFDKAWVSDITTEVKK